MINIAEIEKAIGAHGLWKGRLRAAIDSGSSEFKVEKVQLDNQCDFGKWLYSLPASEQQSEFGKKVMALHKEFHVQAAQLLSLAVTGKKKEAEAAISLGSNFSRISSELTRTLSEWKKVAK